MTITQKHISIIDSAVNHLCVKLLPVGIETISIHQSTGRILAQPITMDRPSPPCDVSAMDGYALRHQDVTAGIIPISGSIPAGMPAPTLAPATTLKIFTGAMLPALADVVIPREQVHEFADHIEIPNNLAVKSGQHIRRQGENARAGQCIARAGTTITPPLLGAIAGCGMSEIQVYRKVRINLLISGNELRQNNQSVSDWQLRDSNGMMLHGLLSTLPWAHIVSCHHMPDDPTITRQIITRALESCDALFLTGGVSAGDHDYIPQALADIGAQTIFHKLPIKPGKPVLGAIGPTGQLIYALPGNPVAAMIAARRLAAPALRQLAGFTDNWPSPQQVNLTSDVPRSDKLTLFQLVTLNQNGLADPTPNRGSGDWVSAAASSGFIEIPTGQTSLHNLSYYPWRLD